MILSEVTFQNKSDLEFVEKLYIESFPAYERRPVLEMHHIMQEDERFKILLLVNECGVRIGFFTVWDFSNFHFVEHFAISPEQRNSGSGTKALFALKNRVSLPIVAEIELPESSEFANRRLNFYKKNGFQDWDLDYMQPPYAEGFNSIPMKILTYGDLGFPVNFKEVTGILHKEVYKI